MTRGLAAIALAGLKTRHYNGDSGEEASEGGTEIARGHKAAGKGARGLALAGLKTRHYNPAWNARR